LITVGLKIESVVDWSGSEQIGFSSHSHTVHVTEFEHASTPRARERSPDQAKRWMWAEDMVARDPEANGACVTYVTVVLTRDILWALGWILHPFAEHLPAETLTNMLQRTRSAAELREDAYQLPYVFSRSDHPF